MLRLVCWPSPPVRCGLSAVLLLVGALWMVPHGDFLRQPEAVPQFWIGAAVMGVGYSLSWGIGQVGAGWFWAVAILTRLLLLPMHPGDDIWRYIWEGYLQTQGISPYDFPPNAPELLSYRPDWWAQINHPDVSAIYPPITQFGFRILASISPTVWLFKLSFALADLAICGLLSRYAGYSATLLYAWNPLVIYVFAGGGHYDSWFLLPLVAGGLLLMPAKPSARSQSVRHTQPAWRWIGSAGLVGISIAVKWMSLPILAFLGWRSLLRFGPRLGMGTLLMGLMPFALAAVPFCSPTACPLVPTESVFVAYGRSAELIPFWVEQVWPPSRWENWLFAFPLALVVVWLLLRAKTFQQFTEWYLIALLSLSPIIHAWYFAWLAPFAVVSRNWGTRLVCLSAFIYFVLPHRIALGDSSWYLSRLERWGLWLPFILGLVGFIGWRDGLRPTLSTFSRKPHS